MFCKKEYKIAVPTNSMTGYLFCVLTVGNLTVMRNCNDVSEKIEAETALVQTEHLSVLLNCVKTGIVRSDIHDYGILRYGTAKYVTYKHTVSTFMVSRMMVPTHQSPL
jgi:sRNA-binding regulator protein Hfq